MPSFGGFGKAVGGAFKRAGKNMRGAMTGNAGGINAGPSGGFMSRFKSAAPMALNNAAQMWGGQMAPMARMTGGMMRRPQPAPTGNTGFTGIGMPGGNMPIPQPGGNTGVAGPAPINTAPSPNFIPNMGGNTGFTGGMFPSSGGFDLGKMTGGNTGIAGGLFNRPRLDSAGQYTMPMGNEASILSRYFNSGDGQAPTRPQVYY